MRQAVLDASCQAYEAARWRIPSDFLQRSHFDRVVQNLDWTSSPGYPFLLRAPNNKVLFGTDDQGCVDEAKASIIWQIVQDRISGKEKAGYIRLFIKPEAHTAKKLADERYRLISSVNVVDQIVDHMLFGDMNGTCIANWPFIPSKPGWSIAKGGWRFMPSEVWMATDASAWDWTVRPWLLEMALELRMLLCDNLSEQWSTLATRRYRELFTQPEFVTSGGLVLKQKTPGVMKSGCVNTISDNSIMQFILHARVCLELGLPVTPMFSMGDDRLQVPVRDQKSYVGLTSQFCILKSVQLKNEFAGFEFRGSVVDPVHKGKHAFNILHMDDEVAESMANSYVLNYHRSPWRNWMERLFNGMGIELIPRTARDVIFDGF
ncbi:hypothetical protein [Hubei sobemo-like virus 26]|uniref:hypothetical protein n=1 Tax=Hubei sobemo-like virus 26 TaxID=1923212 RepID=UPI00090AEE63|nr:hypothetical protein [Hubei sobemo-like virus 26]APG75647.1 hypothetical protein [Hubei sobemo-like virus 26]